MSRITRGFNLDERTSHRLSVAASMHKISKSQMVEDAIHAWINKLEHNEDEEEVLEKAIVCFSLFDTSSIIVCASGKILEEYICESGAADCLWDDKPASKGGIWVWEGEPKKEDEKLKLDGRWRRPSYIEWCSLMMCNPLWANG